MNLPLWVTVVASLSSGLLTFAISTHFYVSYENRRQKLEVFRKIMANRYALVVREN